MSPGRFVEETTFNIGTDRFHGYYVVSHAIIDRAKGLVCTQWVMLCSHLRQDRSLHHAVLYGFLRNLLYLRNHHGNSTGDATFGRRTGTASPARARFEHNDFGKPPGHSHRKATLRRGHTVHFVAERLLGCARTTVSDPCCTVAIYA